MPTGAYDYHIKLQLKDQQQKTGLYFGLRTKFSESVSHCLKDNINTILLFLSTVLLFVASLFCSHPQNWNCLWNFLLLRDSFVYCDYIYALKILPACLDLFKLQGFMTGIGVPNQDKMRGEKNQKVTSGQVYNLQAFLTIQMQLQLRVVAILLCLLLIKVT